MTSGDASRGTGGRPLRILAAHSFFWPDTPPYASILKAIVDRWAEEGHAVTVWSSQPHYKPEVRLPPQPARSELETGVEVRRYTPWTRSRTRAGTLLRSLQFLSGLAWRAWRGRYDVLMISTSPPVLAGFAAAWASRISGARLVYNCLDLHPEIGRISGEFRRPWLYRILERMDAWSCRQASRVVVLSPDMAAAVRSRPGCERVPIEEIQNFATEGVEAVALPQVGRGNGRAPSPLRLIFAGNLGRFQALPAVAGAVADPRLDRVSLTFVGEGKVKRELEAIGAAAPDGRIDFVPHVEQSVAYRMMDDADLGVVSLVPGVERYAFPSKTLAYLRRGLPVLMIVPRESSVARLVIDEGVGVVAEPGDAEGLVRLLADLDGDRDRLWRLRERAREVGPEMFSQSRQLQLWSTLIRDVAGAG